MIELARERGLLPPTSAVAALACAIAEFALVYILVTRLAAVEAKSDVLHFAIRLGHVAGLAFHLGVRSGQRVASLRVVDPRSGAPTTLIMALLAISSLAPIVFVFVTGGARGRKSQVGVVCVSSAQRQTFAGCDVLR